MIASRKFTFCSGHRLVGHEGKCRHLHGHNYEMWVDIESQDLDALGMVIDFSIMKDRIGNWIDTHWDHKTILWDQDDLFDAEEPFDTSEKLKEHLVFVPFNPTAENMCRYLIGTVFPELFKDEIVCVTRVRIYETENCFAEASI